MTADHFVEIVRKGSDKLRVDNIVLDTGAGHVPLSPGHLKWAWGASGLTELVVGAGFWISGR